MAVIVLDYTVVAQVGFGGDLVVDFLGDGGRGLTVLHLFIPGQQDGGQQLELIEVYPRPAVGERGGGAAKAALVAPPDVEGLDGAGTFPREPGRRPPVGVRARTRGQVPLREDDDVAPPGNRVPAPHEHCPPRIRHGEGILEKAEREAGLLRNHKGRARHKGKQDRHIQDGRMVGDDDRRPEGLELLFVLFRHFQFHEGYAAEKGDEQAAGKGDRSPRKLLEEILLRNEKLENQKDEGCQDGYDGEKHRSHKLGKQPVCVEGEIPYLGQIFLCPAGHR